MIAACVGKLAGPSANFDFVAMADPTIAVGVAVVTPSQVTLSDITVSEVLDEAQRLGEPRFVLKDYESSYFLWRRTAEEIVTRCDAAGTEVRDMLTAKLTEAAEAYGAKPRDAAWLLRDAFEQLNSKGAATRKVMLEGMPDVVAILAEGYPVLARPEQYPRGSIPLKLSTLRGAIAMATKVGKGTYDEGNHEGATYVLARAVGEMMEHVVQESAGGPDALSTLQQLHAEAQALAVEADNDGAATGMLRGLAQLASAETNPAMREGMKNPNRFLMEDGFPEGKASGGGGGCCVVA